MSRGPERSELHGHQLLVLDPETQPKPFSFGIRKAELILTNINEIIEFVKDEGDPMVIDRFWEEIQLGGDSNLEGVDDVNSSTEKAE